MRKFWTGALVVTILIGLLAITPLGWAKEPYRQVLISADRNMNVDPFLTGRYAIVSRYGVPDCPTPWSARKFPTQQPSHRAPAQPGSQPVAR